MGLSRKSRGRLLLEACICDLDSAMIRYARHLASQRDIGGMFHPGDAVQNGYLRACEKIDRFNGNTLNDVANWLRRIIYFEVLNLRHHSKCERRALERTDPGVRGSERLEEIPEERTTPGEQLEAMERSQAYLYALSQLSPLQFKVFCLRYLEGLPVKEVARRLGKRPSAVAKTTQRARKHLRRTLGALPEFKTDAE